MPMKRRTPPRTNASLSNPERAAFVPVVRVIERYGDELRRHPDVVNIRPGYRIRDGWFAEPPEPVIVVSVLQKKPRSQLSDAAMLPRTVHGVPLDVKPASPLEQMKASGGAPAAVAAALEAMSEAIAGDNVAIPGWDLLPAAARPITHLDAALALHPYEPPPGLKLAEVRAAMTLTCCVSPEHGWKQLQPFLEAVNDRFTIAMYDFTAPHILATLKEAMTRASGQLRLILDPKVALPSAGQRRNSNKRDDETEEVVEDELRRALARRFSFVWAAVTSRDKVSGGLFPSAYHIKVSVRDGSTFWLSSGNWQSSNQPDVAKLQLSAPQLQQQYNREWHVILQHDGLASLYERFIEWDMQRARPFQIQPEDLPNPDLSVPVDSALAAALAAKRYTEFPPKTVTFTTAEPLRVQPLLTPDNYVDHVIKLIRGAKKTIWFQNQYIKPTTDSAPAFKRAMAELRKKQKSKVDVKIILRNEGDIRTMLEALRYEGFDMKKVRLQSGCHNKGIIIDSQVVVVGSHNWSSAGVTRNRDASLVFYDAGVAQYFEKVFLYDWETLAHQRVASEAAPPQIAAGLATGAVMPWSDYYED